MELSTVLPKLQEWFPAEDHKERKIKGGGTWYYLPHQSIRDRLNELCPGHWSTEYSEPHIIDGEPIYHCRLTICGVTRTGIGDKSNEPSPYGTSAQRAFRKAFTDAAEQFGIGAYLDEQTSDRTKRAFVKYMQSQGNGKAAVNYRSQQQKPEVAAAPVIRHPDLPNPDLISESQRKRLYAIAKSEGGFTDGGFKRLIEGCGFAASKDITKEVYEDICDRAKDPEQAKIYNQEPPVEAA